MKRSNRLMLVLGVLLAVVAFGGVLLFGSSPGSTTPKSTTVSVVTAALDVPLGTTLDDTYLTTIQMPTDAAVDTYRDTSQLVGLVVRRSVLQGEAFRSTDFQSGSAANAPEIAKALKPGQRAMAVLVDALSGVGAIIQAGDYVDVIATLTDQPDPPKAPIVAEFKDNSGLPATKIPDDWLNNTSIKVLVQNVQVMGSVLPPLDPSGNSVASTDPDTGQPVAGGSIVILSVTPQQAELVRFAQVDGRLYLIMRAPQDATAPDVVTTGVTLRELVDEHGVLPPRVIVSKFP